MRIWVNTLVQNEDMYLWYAVESVARYVDHVLIWDTGSTDKTRQIINDLAQKYPGKISSKFIGSVGPEAYPGVRNKMLNHSNADWVVLVDGDEVWWDESIENLVGEIRKNGEQLDTIVSKYVNLVGDMYHKQSASAGKYNIDGYIGNLTIRAMSKKILGLNFSKPHGQLGIFDNEKVLIQNRDKKRRLHIEGTAFLHLTHLKRSSTSDVHVPKRGFKYKHELGEDLSLDYYYPEAFFRPYPNYLESVWQKRSEAYFVRAALFTPLKNLKRKIYIPSKSGY